MIRYLQKLKAKKGFTLVELLVVIAIIGILAAVLVPLMSTFLNNARVSNANQVARNCKTVLDTWILAEQTSGAATRGVVAGTTRATVMVQMPAVEANLIFDFAGGTGAGWKNVGNTRTSLAALFNESFANASAGSVFVANIEIVGSEYLCTAVRFFDSDIPNAVAVSGIGTPASAIATAQGLTLTAGRVSGHATAANNGTVVGEYTG